MPFEFNSTENIIANDKNYNNETASVDTSENESITNVDQSLEQSISESEQIRLQIVEKLTRSNLEFKNRINSIVNQAVSDEYQARNTANSIIKYLNTLPDAEIVTLEQMDTTLTEKSARVTMLEAAISGVIETMNRVPAQLETLYSSQEAYTLENMHSIIDSAHAYITNVAMQYGLSTVGMYMTLDGAKKTISYETIMNLNTIAELREKQAPSSVIQAFVEFRTKYYEPFSKSINSFRNKSSQVLDSKYKVYSNFDTLSNPVFERFNNFSGSSELKSICVNINDTLFNQKKQEQSASGKKVIKHTVF